MFNFFNKKSEGVEKYLLSQIESYKDIYKAIRNDHKEFVIKLHNKLFPSETVLLIDNIEKLEEKILKEIDRLVKERAVFEKPKKPIRHEDGITSIPDNKIYINGKPIIDPSLSFSSNILKGLRFLGGEIQFSELVEFLSRQGLEESRNKGKKSNVPGFYQHVSAHLSNLRRQGLIEKVRHGVWKAALDSKKKIPFVYLILEFLNQRASTLDDVFCYLVEKGHLEPYNQLGENTKKERVRVHLHNLKVRNLVKLNRTWGRKNIWNITEKGKEKISKMEKEVQLSL